MSVALKRLLRASAFSLGLGMMVALAGAVTIALIDMYLVVLVTLVVSFVFFYRLK